MFFQSNRSQSPDGFAELVGEFRESRAHACRDIDHADTLALQSDLLQQVRQVIDSLFGVEVATQIVAASRQSSRDHYPVGALLEGLHYLHDIGTSGTGDGDDLQVRRIRHARTARQIRCGIGAMHAAQGNDLRLE